MDIQWKYRIIDDFFPDDIFAELAALPVDHVKPRQVIRYQHIVEDNKVTQYSLLDRALVKRIHTLYYDRMLQVLKELAPEKVDRVDRSSLYIAIMGKDTKKGPHIDLTQKLLTVIVYVSPEKNNATVLHNTKDGADAYPIEWKPNRALVYSDTKDGWHSYKTDGIANRLTVIYTLQGTPPEYEYSKEHNRRRDRPVFVGTH